MEKIWIIVVREYLSRVRRRSFIITTLLAPLGFILLMLSVVFITKISQSSKIIAVVDDSKVFEEFRFADSETRSVFFKFVNSDIDTMIGIMERSESGINGILYIPRDFDIDYPNRTGIQYFSSERTGIFTKQFLDKSVNDVVNRLKLEKNIADEDILASLKEEAKVNYNTGFGKEKEGFTEVAAILGYITGFIIYIALFVYGTMIMKGVMEEKASRVVEVLASSVRPFQLMLGKIIGVGAVGLTQFLLWGVLITLSNLFLGIVLGLSIGSEQYAPMGGTTSAHQMDVEDIQLVISHLSEIKFLPLFIGVVFYFLGGFFFYGALFAAIGAAAGDDSDMQSLTFPVSIPIIVSIIIMNSVIGDPDSKLAMWASLIPFSSPIIMPALLPFNPPLWQLALSSFMLIAGFVGTTYVAAKIYRVGILMYGKGTSIKQIGKWLFSGG